MPGSLGQKTTVGKLRHRVRIEAATTAPNDFRELVETWATEAEVWALVENVRGDELDQADRVQSVATHKVTMRYRDGLTPKKRLVWLKSENLKLNIVAVLPMEGQANYVELLCRAAEAIEG